VRPRCGHHDVDYVDEGIASPPIQICSSGSTVTTKLFAGNGLIIGNSMETDSVDFRATPLQVVKDSVKFLLILRVCDVTLSLAWKFKCFIGDGLEILFVSILFFDDQCQHLALVTIGRLCTFFSTIAGCTPLLSGTALSARRG